MMNKKIIASAAFAMLLPAAQTIAGATDDAATRIDATDTLPDAKPGQCFAKVIIPAKYETKLEQVLLKAASETIKINPAVFGSAEKSVVVKAGYTRIKTVPAKFRSVVEKIETSPASTQWMTSLTKRALPASPALLAGAKASNLSLDAAAVSSCFKEYFVPAGYTTVEKDVLVKEGFDTLSVAAATFKSGTETIVIREASQRSVYHPTQFQTVEERIEIEPAKTVWKKGDGPITRIDNSTGEIMCLVEVPAKYKTITTTTVKAASRVETITTPEATKAIQVSLLAGDAAVQKTAQAAAYDKVSYTTKSSDANFSWRAAGTKGAGTFTGNQVCLVAKPAKYTSVQKLVVASAAATEEVKVPAVTKTVKVKTVVSKPEEVRTTIPAVYGNIEKRSRVASERLEWRSVLCKTNMNKGVNKDIQVALKAKGFYDGPIDGIWGRGTMGGIEKFQIKHGLARGGLTIDALEKLGVM